MKEIFDKNEILKVIEAYSKTSTGREEIKKHIPDRTREFVPRYYDKKSEFRKLSQARKAGEDMANILYRHITVDTVTTKDGREREGLRHFNREDIHVEPMYKTGAGEYVCEISFTRSALHRDSVYPEKYGGVDDIISLFVHGYSGAKHSAFGTWNKSTGEEIDIHTPTNKPANDFMNNAIKEFNAKYNGKAIATLKEDYR